MSETGHLVHATAPVERRAAAIEAALEAQGLKPGEFVAEATRRAEEEWVPANGARMVARALDRPGLSAAAARRWPRRCRRVRLRAAAAPSAPGVPREHADGAQRHLLHALLVHRVHHHRPAARLVQGPEYRARVVRESRTVLKEMGLALPPEVEIRVWDTTADTRYVVLPMRPPETAGWPEERLAAIVTRDSMIGVARL
jgi:nitrile hydratase